MFFRGLQNLLNVQPPTASECVGDVPTHAKAVGGCTFSQKKQFGKIILALFLGCGIHGYL